MSKYDEYKVTGIRDYPLGSRKSKVTIEQFSQPLRENSISGLIASFPDLLAAKKLQFLADRIKEARDKGRGIIWGFGGHVIKAGLSPILIDLMERNFITALATNGSSIVHDFEIAFCGHTSEEVDEQLGSGAFGMARETAECLNQAISLGASRGKGIGESVGHFLEGSSLEYPQLSLLLQAYKRDIPCSVHVAIGTDIIHNHPTASGEALGKGSLIDFRVFAKQVSLLNDGGVYLNVGSAVILPEVFLKAVSIIRNTGSELEGFTTAHLDFIQHYRPSKNVLERPVSETGVGIGLTGHHEIMVPLLAALLIHG